MGRFTEKTQNLLQHCCLAWSRLHFKRSWYSCQTQQRLKP